MIHGEISRVLVLHPALATTRCAKHCRAELRLDNAFVLIEGHPSLTDRFPREVWWDQLIRWYCIDRLSRHRLSGLTRGRAPKGVGRFLRVVIGLQIGYSFHASPSSTPDHEPG